jgi:hypothetical protein
MQVGERRGRLAFSITFAYDRLTESFELLLTPQARAGGVQFRLGRLRMRLVMTASVIGRGAILLVGAYGSVVRDSQTTENSSAARASLASSSIIPELAQATESGL